MDTLNCLASNVCKVETCFWVVFRKCSGSVVIHVELFGSAAIHVELLAEQTSSSISNSFVMAHLNSYTSRAQTQKFVGLALQVNLEYVLPATPRDL